MHCSLSVFDYCPECRAATPEGKKADAAGKKLLGIVSSWSPDLLKYHQRICTNYKCPNDWSKRRLMFKCPCDKAVYCDRNCQVAHWRAVHKNKCTARVHKKKESTPSPGAPAPV